MHGTFRRRIATAALAAAAFTAFSAAAPAFADITTDGTGSTGGGNQAQAPISAPINLCGNGGSLLGASAALCQGKATVNNPTGGDDAPTTSGTGSVLGGNQAQAPASAPINACGNGISGGGKAASDCAPGSDATVNQP